MYQEVINFWFNELQPGQWFEKDPELDALISERFGGLMAQAKRAELSDWRTSTAGRLAEIIVLDQFSRNIFRGRASAFEADAVALVLAQEAVRNGCDQELEPPKRVFFYMPYMHSESRLIHQHAVKLFEQPGLERHLGYEIQHQVIIDRFGRYPHRNQILSRESTPEEIAFLKEPGSSF